MIEITEEKYNELRNKADKNCGRVYSWERKEVIIYFQMEDGDENMVSEKNLRELAIGHPITAGKYDVFRHWTYPEVENVNYQVP